MAWLSVRAQDRAIRREWPFRTVFAGTSMGLWRGTITSLSAEYEISVLYVLQPEQDGFEYDHAWFPEVRVLNAPLTRRPETPDEPIPHVYREGIDARPVLCLFDPAERGWWPDQSIATTTLPLVADWLRFYEAWMATGIWTGGGREHGSGPIGRRMSERPFPTAVDRTVEGHAGLSSSRLTLASRTGGRRPPYRSQLADLLSQRFPDAPRETDVTPEPMATAA